jgi:lysophospholipid acyltransferase (LPLAT)-like uncharacterized protein
LDYIFCRKILLLARRVGSGTRWLRRLNMKIRSQRLTRWLAWLVVRMYQLLFRTCRLVYLAPEPWLKLNSVAGPDDARRGILCVWHDVLLIPTFAGVPAARRQTCCLVSKHQDGTYLAEVMGFLGYTTVRGSSKRGGAGAVKQMLEDTAGRHIVITPDGPRGPRRKMKPGAVYVATQTGRPISAGAYACRRAWRIPADWTDFVIPKPFTTIYVVTGTPFYVPPDLTRDQLEEWVLRMQEAMDRLSDQVERLARGEIVRIEFAPPAEAIRAAG